MAGKLGFRGLVNAVPPCQLVYVMDQLSNKRFLVDTSAAYSILPHQSSGQPTGPHLAGPDGHPLACWGDKPVQLVLDGCPFQWKFLLAAVHAQSSALTSYVLIIFLRTLSTAGSWTCHLSGFVG